jgi:hypothetical protein
VCCENSTPAQDQPAPNATLAHDLAALGDLNGEVVRLLRQYELLLARLKLWRFGVET